MNELDFDSNNENSDLLWGTSEKLKDTFNNLSLVFHWLLGGGMFHSKTVKAFFSLLFPLRKLNKDGVCLPSVTKSK